MTFKITENAPAGEIPIVVSYDPEEIYNKDLQNVSFESISGKVTVEKKEVTDPNAPQIFLDSKKATVGHTFTVTANLKNNPGFNAMNLAFVYDTDVFTLTKAENMVEGMTMTSGTAYVWDCERDYTNSGALVRLTFQVSADAPEGEYPIRIVFLGASNESFEEVPMSVVDGKITVSSVVYGDANGDGKVTTVDLSMLRKYMANIDPLTGLSSVAVNPGADANGDGKISTVDLSMLRKYFANIDPLTGESSIVLGPKE